MDNKPERIKIFKYNAILSVIFFLMSTFYLGVKTKNYSFTDYTISEMVGFLSQPQLFLYNSLFFIKCFLDLSFTYYVIKYYHLQLKTFTSIIWLMAVLSFGLLGFFPTNQFHFIHLGIVAVIFISWAFSQYTLARLTGDEKFVHFSKTIILIESVVGNIFIFTNYFNAIAETIFLLLLFLWLTIFIGRYLK
jgi:hypothetical protein